MNQRFQNVEKGLVKERCSENELYKAINSIGHKLEYELKEFGLCPEECFMETLELLSVIADKGEKIMPEVENLWLRKENEYRGYGRQVNEDEIRKAVGIVFGFAILAIDSSRHSFYRYRLKEELMFVITNHKWEGWSKTIGQIFDVPLPDGWFDTYINEEPEGDGDMLELTKSINSLRNQMPNAPLIVQFVQQQYNTSCQQFMGKMLNPQFTIPQQNEAV